MLFTTIVLLFVISCIRAAVIPRPHDSNVHENGYENEVYDPLKVQHAWHQPADHPVHSLFRRDIDDTVYTPVGSAGESFIPPVILLNVSILRLGHTLPSRLCYPESEFNTP